MFPYNLTSFQDKAQDYLQNTKLSNTQQAKTQTNHIHVNIYDNAKFSYKLTKFASLTLYSERMTKINYDNRFLQVGPLVTVRG